MPKTQLVINHPQSVPYDMVARLCADPSWAADILMTLACIHIEAGGTKEEWKTISLSSWFAAQKIRELTKD